jgi:hypothetical protein
MRATGIGSLPFRSLERARALIERFELPFLPELPNIDSKDLMLERPFAGAPGPGLALLEGTKATEVKVQLAGPTVLGTWAKESPASALKRVEEGAKTLLARLAGRKVIVFLDEPGLEGPSSALAEAVLRVRAAGAHKVGVHDCGPGFKHAIAARPDYLSFDLAFFKPDSQVTDFVAQGGKLSFGAVSTTAPHDRERVLRLLRSFPPSLLEGALVTPACGTALLEEDRAESAHLEALEIARA